MTVSRAGTHRYGLFCYYYYNLLFLTKVFLTPQQASKPSTPAAGPTDEGKRAERLAKLEAWKQKQAAEKERKQREQTGSGGARNILEEIDRKSGALPATNVPETTAAPAPDATSVVPTRKFDPKAIAKSVTPTTAAPAVLGEDVAVPQNVKASAAQSSAPSSASSCKSCSFLPDVYLN